MDGQSLTIEAEGPRQLQAFRGRYGFYPIDTRCPFALVALGDPSDRDKLCRPGMHHQALEPANCADIATTGGLVNTRLQLKHLSLETAPRNGVPSIHRSDDRGHSLLTATCVSTVHVTVPPSAYPPAFPGAFASETIPLPTRMRLTPTPH